MNGDAAKDEDVFVSKFVVFNIHIAWHLWIFIK